MDENNSDGPADAPPTVSPISTAALANMKPDWAHADAYTLPYTLGGGDHVLAVHSGLANFQDAAGNWHRIDPTLQGQKDGSFTNAADSFSYSLPATWSSASPITVTRRGASYSFAIDGMQPTAAVQLDSTTVIYRGVLPGVDFRFTSVPGGYLDDVIIDNVTDATQPIAYDVALNGLAPKASADGGVDLTDASGVVAHLSFPVTKDKTGIDVSKSNYTVKVVDPPMLSSV